MSTETLREPENTWRRQPIYVLLENETETLYLHALVDNCSERSCLLDTRVKEMKLWNRVALYDTNQKPMNRMYLRLLNKVSSKAGEDEEFRTSRLLPLHKIMVKVFKFEKSTRCRTCIGRGLINRHRYYSMGTIKLKYCYREEMNDGDQIPDMRWSEHEFLVIDTSDGYTLDENTNFDVLLGLNSGIFDKLWYQRHIRRRPEERPSVRQRTIPDPITSWVRNELGKKSSIVKLRSYSI